MSTNLDIAPIFGVITAQSSPDPLPTGSHTYTAIVNTPTGVLRDVPINRPEVEFWRNNPSLHTYPLPVYSGVFGSLVGDTMHFNYIEPPRIDPCGAGTPALSLLERLVIELEQASPNMRTMFAARLRQIVEDAP